MVVAQLAVLSAGGAYVPLDPAYPLQRLHDMALDAALTLLVTEQTLAALWQDLDAAEAAARPGAGGAAGSSPATAPGGRSGARRPAAGPGLCHLHLGFHRQAQGRGGAAPLGGELPAVDAA